MAVRSRGGRKLSNQFTEWASISVKPGICQQPTTESSLYWTSRQVYRFFPVGEHHNIAILLLESSRTPRIFFICGLYILRLFSRHCQILWSSTGRRWVFLPVFVKRSEGFSVRMDINVSKKAGQQNRMKWNEKIGSSWLVVVFHQDFHRPQWTCFSLYFLNCTDLGRFQMLSHLNSISATPLEEELALNCGTSHFYPARLGNVLMSHLCLV